MRWIALFCWLVFPRLVFADEPSPMSFDDLEAMEAAPSPARAAVRAKRRVDIDFAEDAIEGEVVIGTDRLHLQLQLAHLYHELGRDEGDTAAIERAIGLYRELLVRLPGDLLQDHVTFFLGFALRSVDRDDEAAELLGRVVTTWPSSSFVPHAWLHLGEARFEAEEYQSALDAYSRASQYADFELRGFAVYKMAWSYERQGSPDLARATMAEVVLDPERPALAAASLDVLDFWFRRDLGRPADQRYFEAVRLAGAGGSPSGVDPCLKNIPGLKARIREDPMSADAPRLQLGVVGCLVDVGRLGPARTEVRRMEHTYGRGSRWFEANDARARREARRLIRSAVERVQHR